LTEADPSQPGASPISRAAPAAGFIFLFGFSLWSRWPLVTEGLWRDEAAAVYVARSASLSEFAARHHATEYTPPLFNALLAVEGRFFGFDERALKAFALGLGFLALAGIAALTAELFGSWAAFGAAVLAANNPILLGLSAELRPYSLSVALAAVSLVLVSRLRRKPDSAGWKRAVVLTLCLTLLAYSHIAGALTVLAIGGVGLLQLARPKSRAFGRAVAGAAAIAGATFAVWLPIAWTQFRAGIAYEPPLGMAARWQVLLARIDLTLPDFGGAPWLLAAVGIVIASLLSRAVRARLRPVAPDFVLLFACAFVVAVPLGLFSRADRYLAIPAALLAVAAAGLFAKVFASGQSVSAYGRVIGLIVFAALLAGSVVARVPFYGQLRRLARLQLPKSGVRTLCHELSPDKRDLLIAVPDYLATTIWYYCGSDPVLRGVALWQDALLLDWRAYSRAWASQRLVAAAMELVESQIASARPARLVLVRDATPPLATPLGFPAKIKAFRRAVEARYPPTRETAYRGRIENVEVTEFRPQGIPRE
jgi:hypothetical protein